MDYREFKRGNIVKYMSGHFGDDEHNPLWNGKCGCIQGIIISMDIPHYGEDCNIRVMWDNGNANTYNVTDLEKIINKTITKETKCEDITEFMTKLSLGA